LPRPACAQHQGGWRQAALRDGKDTSRPDVNDLAREARPHETAAMLRETQALETWGLWSSR
jgi:hypothetical protein